MNAPERVPVRARVAARSVDLRWPLLVLCTLSPWLVFPSDFRWIAMLRHGRGCGRKVG